MKHFSETCWADFARNLVEAKERLAMEEHIASGCGTCNTSLQMWRNVVLLAQQESQLTPPADVVRVAKSQFAASAAIRSGRVRLLFDSILQPAMAGVRGTIAARQFLYETDDLYIDLRLEPHREAARMCLVGQILNRATASRTAQNLLVRLFKGDLAIADTSPNQFGEFQLEFELAADVAISIGSDEEQPIILPLYGLHEGGWTIDSA